ncbi:MAG: hypothetical protein ACRCS7_13680 [Tannerellaceae bacterium]
MITFNMTPKEVYNEIFREYNDVLRFSYTKHKPFNRRVVKASVFPVRAYAEYTSKYRNNWFLFFHAESKKQIGPNPLLIVVCYANMQDGYYAYYAGASTIGTFHVCIYPPHFFQRYAQRAEVDKTGVALIRHYFQRNNCFMYDIIKKDDEEILRGVTEEGVLFGKNIGDGVAIMKTFIGWDCANESVYAEMMPMTDDLKSRIKKVHEPKSDWENLKNSLTSKS